MKKQLSKWRKASFILTVKSLREQRISLLFSDPHQNGKLHFHRVKIRQFRQNQVDRVDFMLVSIMFHSRPGIQIPQQLFPAPGIADYKIRMGDLFKRKRNGLILFIDKMTFRVPISFENFSIQFRHRPIDFGIINPDIPIAENN
ncbi:hypothetical protein D3C86_1732340 [compost metagenome]